MTSVIGSDDLRRVRLSPDGQKVVLALLVFCLLRLFAIVGMTPIIHPDSGTYTRLNFVGGASRPWTLPLLYAGLPTDGARMLAQTVFSIAGWSVLAIAIASIVRTRLAKSLALITVLLAGLTQRVTTWDAALLSESLALSLTGALLAAWIWLDVDRITTAVAFSVVFALWAFVRDAHAYLAVLVVVAVLVRTRHRLHSRQVLIFAASVTSIAGWALSTGANDDSIEGFNVAANIAQRIDDDDIGWFIERGMPRFEGIDEPPGVARFSKARTDQEFLRWASEEGPAAYTRFLVKHPTFAGQAIGAIFVDDGHNSGSLLDQSLGYATTRAVLPSALDDLVWSSHDQRKLAVVIVLTVLAVLFRWRITGWDRRLVLPILLAASTLPHAFLAYHGAPAELGRHGVVLAMVLVVAVYTAAAIVVDVARTTTARSESGLEVAQSV